MAQLNLEELARGHTYLPPENGLQLAQAAAICLSDCGHQSGVCLSMHGDFTESFEIFWQIPLTPAMRGFWNDMQVTTEYGAYGVALLLMKELGGWRILERSRKRTGFDWWLGGDDNFLQHKVRLEVTGILRSNLARVRSRASQKARRFLRYPTEDVRAVAVVEFGTPLAWIGKP